MITAYQTLLESAFPISRDMGVIRGVNEGILLADAFMKDTPFLNTAVGQDMRGLLRRAGIMWRLHDLSRIGDVEYHVEMVPMRRGRWHCIEIHSGIFKAHVCRTDEPGAFPEESMTRSNERSVNPQMDLFDYRDSTHLFPENENKELYAYLTFGVAENLELGHLCWAMESKDGGDWVAFIDVLKRSRVHQEALEKLAAEKPTKTTKVKFHDFIQEALSENSINRQDRA